MSACALIEGLEPAEKKRVLLLALADLIPVSILPWLLAIVLPIHPRPVTDAVVVV